jgi:hypothetical protein
MKHTTKTFLEELVKEELVEEPALVITMGSEAADCTKGMELASLATEGGNLLGKMAVLRMPHLYYIGGRFAKAARSKHWMPKVVQQYDDAVFAMLRKSGSKTDRSQCDLFDRQHKAWLVDPTVANIIGYTLTHADCVLGGETDASDEHKVLHGWKWLVEEGRYEAKWGRAGGIGGGIDASDEYKALHDWLPRAKPSGRALER